VTDPAGSPRRPLPLGKKLGFLLGLLLLLLGLGELAVRALSAPPAPHYLDHPYLRRVRAPGSSHELISPPGTGLEGERYLLHVDGHGFRSRGKVLVFVVVTILVVAFLISLFLAIFLGPEALTNV